jgi:hypothetical protein
VPAARDLAPVGAKARVTALPARRLGLCSA